MASIVNLYVFLQSVHLCGAGDQHGNYWVRRFLHGRNMKFVDIVYVESRPGPRLPFVIDSCK